MYHELPSPVGVAGASQLEIIEAVAKTMGIPVVVSGNVFEIQTEPGLQHREFCKALNIAIQQWQSECTGSPIFYPPLSATASGK